MVKLLSKRKLWAPVVAACLATCAARAAEVSSPAKVLKHTQGNGQVVQALLFQLKAGTQGIIAHDHLVFFDTSASQIGAHRSHAFAVLEAMLKSLPDSDRVQIFAVDVQAEPMMPAADGPRSEAVQSALGALKDRIPLGATNMQSVVEAALQARPKDRASSIAYIGDGMSSADLLETHELEKLVTSLRTNRIPFHSYGVGPQINLQVLGILAHQSGGYVDFDSRLDSSESATGQTQVAGVKGAKLGQAIQQPVVYVTQAQLISGETRTLPLLPLRSDRETIHVVRGALAADAHVVFNDDADQLDWRLAAPVEQQDLAFLSMATDAKDASNGLTNGLAGRAMMQACQQWFAQSLRGELQRGQEHLKLGRADEAAAIARQVAELDPRNIDAETLAQSSQRLLVRPVKQPVPMEPADDQAALEGRELPDPDTSLIREQEQDIRVQTEKLRHRVSEAVGKSQTSDPETGLALLKNVRTAVVVATEIAPEDRAQMLKRLDIEIDQLKILKDKTDQERVHLAERLSQLEARAQLTDKFEQDEIKLESLIDRVRALMLEGKHGRDEAYGEAQNVADVAINLRPGEGTSAAARFDSEAAQQLNRAYRLRARRADQFLETLHQVELAHIPFPDEPPVRYPAADVWRALSERRKQWADVDLRKDSPREKRIQQELKQTTEVNFVDIPLKDALDFLEEVHHIEIVPDQKALSEEGISTDQTVNLVMQGISLRSVLRLMLEPMLLTYVIEDEVLKITTQTEADEKLATRVYPVADLAVPIQSPMMGGGMGGMGGGMGGMGGGMMGGGMGGMGGMGGGMGGMGGGMGGGFFSVPPEAVDAKPAQPKKLDNDAIKSLKKKLVR